MRIFVEPTGLYSRAMVRIARALERFAPSDVQIVRSPHKADVVVMYVIGPDAIPAAIDYQRRGIDYVVVQCCLHTTGLPVEAWRGFWQSAALVWSYYDLSSWIPYGRYLYAPLGLDPAFQGISPGSRLYTAVTTGYVSGPGAEAIHEVWEAVDRVGGRGFHVGPAKVNGVGPSSNWSTGEGIPDHALASVLSKARWVAALRHVEGFELPAVEGLACGARPVMFDQPATRRWFGPWATLVPDVSGPKLASILESIFKWGAPPVSEAERGRVEQAFQWEAITGRFWRILQQVGRQEQEVGV